jgi:hypothetical protein
MHTTATASEMSLLDVNREKGLSAVDACARAMRIFSCLRSEMNGLPYVQLLCSWAKGFREETAAFE